MIVVKVLVFFSVLLTLGEPSAALAHARYLKKTNSQQPSTTSGVDPRCTKSPRLHGEDACVSRITESGCPFVWCVSFRKAHGPNPLAPNEQPQTHTHTQDGEAGVHETMHSAAWSAVLGQAAVLARRRVPERDVLRVPLQAQVRHCPKHGGALRVERRQAQVCAHPRHAGPLAAADAQAFQGPDPKADGPHTQADVGADTVAAASANATTIICTHRNADECVALSFVL